MAEILNLRYETSGDADDDKPWVIAEHIFNIINDYLQPSNTLSATEAAQKLDALFPNNRPDVDGEDKEEAGSFLAEFWEIIVMIAQQIPALHPAQDNLIGLLKALRELPTDLKVDIWGSDCRVWQDLPLIGVHMVEAENYTSEEDEPEKWKNFNAFCARLTRDGLCDMSLMGTHTLSSALEEEPDSRSRAYKAYGETFARQIPVAELWFSIAGKAMFERCRGDVDTEDLKDGCAGHLWENKPLGLSIERWDFWKDRFRTIGAHPVADEPTKEVAKKAHDVMNTIQSQA
ncbi:hypothetical protein BZA77DRAFT_287883 [Pyronema omphalodes]|nr:hypothetical protein BZA77DRAFT_287883 [Pyronema omphalodes]